MYKLCLQKFIINAVFPFSVPKMNRSVTFEHRYTARITITIVFLFYFLRVAMETRHVNKVNWQESKQGCVRLSSSHFLFQTAATLGYSITSTVTVTVVTTCRTRKLCVCVCVWLPCRHVCRCWRCVCWSPPHTVWTERASPPRTQRRPYSGSQWPCWTHTHTHS